MFMIFGTNMGKSQPWAPLEAMMNLSFRDEYWKAICELDLAGSEQVLFTFFFGDGAGLQFS
jgi:hypothetical protein